MTGPRCVFPHFLHTNPRGAKKTVIKKTSIDPSAGPVLPSSPCPGQRRIRRVERNRPPVWQNRSGCAWCGRISSSASRKLPFALSSTMTARETWPARSSFPLPPISLYELDNSNFSLGENQLASANPVQFTAQINGMAIPVRTDRIAVVEPPYDQRTEAKDGYDAPGQEVTRLLEGFSLPLSLDLAKIKGLLAGFDPSTQKRLQQLGLVELYPGQPPIPPLVDYHPLSLARNGFPQARTCSSSTVMIRLRPAASSPGRLRKRSSIPISRS